MNHLIYKEQTVYLTECKKEQIRLITDSPKDVLTGAITNRYEATSCIPVTIIWWKYLKMHWPMKYNY